MIFVRVYGRVKRGVRAREREREREREEKKIREGLNRGEEERRVHKVSAIPWCWRKLSLFSSLHPSPLLDAL